MSYQSLSRNGKRQLDTEKDVDFNGAVSQWPDLQLENLLNGWVRAGSTDQGARPEPSGEDRKHAQPQRQPAARNNEVRAVADVPAGVNADRGEDGNIEESARRYDRGLGHG